MRIILLATAIVLCTTIAQARPLTPAEESAAVINNDPYRAGQEEQFQHIRAKVADELAFAAFAEGCGVIGAAPVLDELIVAPLEAMPPWLWNWGNILAESRAEGLLRAKQEGCQFFRDHPGIVTYLRQEMQLAFCVTYKQC